VTFVQDRHRLAGSAPSARFSAGTWPTRTGRGSPAGTKHRP